MIHHEKGNEGQSQNLGDDAQQVSNEGPNGIVQFEQWWQEEVVNHEICEWWGLKWRAAAKVEKNATPKCFIHGKGNDEQSHGLSETQQVFDEGPN